MLIEFKDENNYLTSIDSDAVTHITRVADGLTTVRLVCGFRIGVKEDYSNVIRKLKIKETSTSFRGYRHARKNDTRRKIP